MRHTYEGQLNKIEEEFDLSIEEKNARAGEIYNKGDSSVKSVAMENMLQVTGNTLVLEKAEGTTVDSYMKETDAIRENALSVFYQYDNKKVITDPETGRPILSSKPGQQADIAKARKALEKRLIALEKRQGFLAVTAEKWVTEGIFGRGFYHGDLHAGNIMISENGATIIDYGNAVQLNQTQQKEITRLVAAVSVGDVDGFIQAFHALLENTPPQTWEQKKDELRAEVQKVFNIGAKELSGQMISLILMRASSIGLEIPAAINNFSQSQIRLQNTIDSVNDVIRGIRKDIEELDRLGADQAAFDVTLLMQKEYLTEGKDQDETIKAYRKKISTDDLEIYREIRIKGRNNRRRFDEDRMNLLKDGDKKTAAVEALEELRRAQDAKRGNLVQLEDEFVKAYRAAFRERRLQSDLATDLRSKLRSDDEQLKATIDKEMELYFEGKEGEKLRTTYEAYRRARSENAGEDEIGKIEDMFLDKYLGMVAVRLDEISEQRRVRNRRIKSFFKIMGEVTNRNLTASLDRLGFFTAYSYKKTLGRKKMKPSPGEVVVGQQVNEEDVRRLGAIENVENHMPVEMPQTILTVMDEKEQKIVIEARLSEIDEVYKKAVLENKRYEKEKGAAKETDKSKQALKAVTIKQIWTGIYDENIKDKGFFIKSDTKKEGDKRAFDAYFDALNKAFEKDFARIQSGGDFLNSQEVEEELHKLLVDMPKAHGGEQFFMDIMNGECLPGRKFDGLAKTKIKDKDTSSIVNTLNSFAAGRYNVDGNEDIKRYVAKTLMIFGEKWERSFALRHKDYESQDRELKRERERIEERRNERFSRDYGYWLGTLKNSKETRKRYLAAGKPVLKDEYKGDKGEAAFLAKIKENGWTFPGDDDIMRSFYRLTMIDCEKGAGKGADPKRVAEYADVLRTMIADITETRADTQKMREDILYQIRRRVEEYGNTDSHDLDDDTNYIDRFKALGIIGKIAHSKRMIQGPLSYWRVRSGRLGYEPKRAHNEKQLLEKMYYNDWLEDDKPLAQVLLSLLLKAYESEAQSKTDEEKSEAKRVIECIEPVITAFETEQLYTAERRSEVLGGLGTLFGDKKDLFGIASDTIMPLVSRELTKEEKDRLERYEKRRIDEEQKRRSEDRLDKMSLENGQIPTNKIYREGKEREKREQELYPDNKFWHVKNKNITRQEWENACDRYGEKGGFENLYKAYTFMYDKASTVLYKEASDEAKAKTILKKAKYSEDFTEKFVDRFFLKGKNESEVADMMMLLLAMNLTKTDRLAGRVEDSEWLPNLQSRTLDGIEMLIELDRGNNAHADEWDIRGAGVLSEKDREELLELVSEERRRLSLSKEERERFDKRRAEEKQRRIEYEKKRAEKEKELAEKEKNRLKEAEEKKWQKIADAEMEKLKTRGIKIENVKDSSIKIMTKDDLKACRKTEYTDEPGDQFSDYDYLSYDEMEKMAAVNHYNNTDDPEFKTLYGSIVVMDKETNKAKVVAYDGDSPFIRHSNGAFVNAFVRAKNSDKPYNNMHNVYKQGSKFTGAKVRNDEDAWEKANEHTVETLDKATQINELPKDCRLVRMVNGDFLKYGLGLEDVITGKKGSINSDELVESINQKAGSVIKNECFTSTSAGIDRQFDGRPVMLTILADKGTKCMMTANYDECDVILGRDKRFALVGAYAHGEKGKMVRRTNIRETYEKKEGKAGKSLDFRGLEIVVKLLNDKEG
jgi:hypothetical protein